MVESCSRRTAGSEVGGLGLRRGCPGQWIFNRSGEIIQVKIGGFIGSDVVGG